MWGESKKSKPIPTPPQILLHPHPTTFAGCGKPVQGKVERGGSSGAGRGKIAILTKFFTIHELASLYE